MKLYLRARDYGLLVLRAEFPGFRERSEDRSDAALAKTTKKHVPELDYTAASWGAAFAIDKADSSLSVDQAIIEKLMRRALVLDEAWELGRCTTSS